MAIVETTSLTSNLLLSIYNRLSDTPVRRFADKSAATKRVNKLLEKFDLQLSDTAVGDNVQQITDVLFLLPKNTPVRKPRKSTAIYAEHEIIEINTPAFKDEKTGELIITNPKRPGTKAHARLQLLINARSMTVGEYLTACHELEGKTKGRHKYRLDLSWDIEHGYIMFPDGANY